MLIRGLGPGAAVSQERAEERERHAGKMRYMLVSHAPTHAQEGEQMCVRNTQSPAPVAACQQRVPEFHINSKYKSYVIPVLSGY